MSETEKTATATEKTEKPLTQAQARRYLDRTLERLRTSGWSALVVAIHDGQDGTDSMTRFVLPDDRTARPRGINLVSSMACAASARLGISVSMEMPAEIRVKLREGAEGKSKEEQEDQS